MPPLLWISLCWTNILLMHQTSRFIIRLLFERNVSKLISKNVLVKSSERTWFFTTILPNYVVHESSKEFWKISHFENMTAGFLLRCQNSLRWEICLIFHWNIDSWKQKLSFGYVMVPKNYFKKSSKYNTDYI